MDAFVTAVKTVRQTPGVDAETSLSPIQTRKAKPVRDVEEGKATRALPGAGTLSPTATVKDAVSPEDALRILRSQPDTETLLATLRKLASPNVFPAFHLAAPGTLQAQILNSIVSHIVPAFWPILHEDEKVVAVRCVRNITGINALLAKLHTVSGLAVKGNRAEFAEQRGIFISVTNEVFSGNTLLLDLLVELDGAVKDKTRRNLAQKEMIGLLGSGKVISSVAGAEDAARDANQGGRQSASWLAAGSEYNKWLGRNIATLFGSNHDLLIESYEGISATGGHLIVRGLSMGYQSHLIKGLVSESLSRRDDGIEELIEHIPHYAKKQFLEQTLRWLSQICPSSEMAEYTGEVVPSLAALLKGLSKHDPAICGQHIRAICGDPVFIVGLSYFVRRACIAVLSDVAPDELQSLFETTMTTFSDRIFIHHSPVLQQESIAQTLLLTAGYLHRANPVAVLIIARSSGHMQGTSSRLDASGQRARWLGMVVATAISGLVDRDGSRMNFGVDEMRTEEASWSCWFAGKEILKPRKILFLLSPGLRISSPTEVIGEKVTEILDDISDEEDDDLKSYAKPDSDAEDSDEDATLVNRNKARPPVYVRDLMSMLRDDKAPDRFELGMKHAAPLIRRKTNFGREVKDHAEELMGLLCNLQDPFDTDQFEELKLRAMIAILLSDMDEMGPWLSRHAFVEGYSIAQRCIMLSAVGLGGRELAGFENEDELNPALPNTDFPSKRLPARLHATYSNAPVSSVKRLDRASSKIQNQLIQPLALQAADHSTAHLNAVKVRTFSSRMAVERTKRKPAPNQLAKTFGQSFYFPLTNRYQQELAAYGSRSVFASAPVVLVTFLKTLALLFHASGPATLGLPELTAEFWDLALAASLTVLDVNTADQKRSLAQEEGKRMVEMQQWVQVVFERAGGGELISGGSQEEAKIRTLAAGVLVKIGEMVEQYQKAMFGSVER
ncbi:telomere binding protein [Friedmanniomyces endolithicus]|nr:telomere binding protein [Friedmanniomyces endolithicus]KAK0776529.1 telomere binding protein [Friedmanniomyces endolithicus]KAK0782092.1 telomere binding protein [Friedmanniomyces endolithicus]